jgi:two-component system OmpR family response regulator
MLRARALSIVQEFGVLVMATFGEVDRPLRILVVDEDSDMRRTVINYLDEHGMHALPASGHLQVNHHVIRTDPDLIVLDPPCKERQGLDLLREIRSRSDVPIIITAAHRCGEMDRVAGLELGADDYVTKPFGLRELVARIRAVLRRQKTSYSAKRSGPTQGRCQFGGWQLDRRTRSLTDANGAFVALSKGEYALLIAFLDEPQRPLSREHLLQATRMHEDIFDRSIDVQVLRLRRKLTADAGAPCIMTERGIGYTFVLPVEALD